MVLWQQSLRAGSAIVLLGKAKELAETNGEVNATSRHSIRTQRAQPKLYTKQQKPSILIVRTEGASNAKKIFGFSDFHARDIFESNIRPQPIENHRDLVRQHRHKHRFDKVLASSKEPCIPAVADI